MTHLPLSRSNSQLSGLRRLLQLIVSYLGNDRSFSPFGFRGFGFSKALHFASFGVLGLPFGQPPPNLRIRLISFEPLRLASVLTLPIRLAKISKTFANYAKKGVFLFNLTPPLPYITVCDSNSILLRARPI